MTGAARGAADAIPRALVQRWIDLASRPASEVPWGDIPADWFGARHIAYLRVLGAQGPDDDHPDAWTWYAFDDLARRSPDMTLDLVLASLRACRTPAEVALLAAGPLEDVIARNGPAVIDRIECLAQTIPRFRFALWAVRQRERDTDETVRRIRTARGLGPEFGFDPSRLPPMP